MLKYISHRMALQLVACQIIEEDDESVYEYGILLLLMNVFTQICIISVGYMVKQLFVTFIFLIALIQLRHYAGGYHAPSFAKCFCISCGSYGCALGMIYLQSQIAIWPVLIGISLLASYYLCKIGSLNSENNPKTQEEMKIRALRTRFITICYSFIAILLFFVYHQWSNIATVIVTVQFISAIAVYTTKTKGELK